MTFSILSVCTGNICRSPVAELILARDLAPLGVVRVESAGTGALVGAGVPETARALAATVGIDTTPHAARQIDTSLIRSADLVLTMAREHRRIVVENVPAAMRRAFTLRELARIADNVQPQLEEAVRTANARTPEDAIRTAVTLAASLRGTVPPPESADEFDIVDPYRRSEPVFQQSFEELRPAAERVSQFLMAAAAAANRE